MDELEHARLHRGRRRAPPRSSTRPAARCRRRPPGTLLRQGERLQLRAAGRRVAPDPLDRPRGHQRRRRAAARPPPRRSGRGWRSGDAAWYSGHGRYGTGPDFDRNFIEFRLYDTGRQAARRRSTATSALETVAARRAARTRGRSSWTRIEREPTLQVDLSNAGNLRLVGSRTTTSSAPASSTGRSSAPAREVSHRRRRRSSATTRRSRPAAVPGDGLLRLRDELLRRRAARDRGLRHHAGRHARSPTA